MPFDRVDKNCIALGVFLMEMSSYIKTAVFEKS